MAQMTLADVFETIVQPERGVGFRGYDGSTGGPPDAEVVLEVVRPRAVAYLAGAPSELGLARAYVAGDLEIVGDPYVALSRLHPFDLDHLTLGDRVRLVTRLAPHALRRVPPPPQEHRVRGRRHSRRRDADAVEHHYDVSNRFYSYVLGPSMAYTCAVFSTEASSLEDAQVAKFDLVCRKLGLGPGMRLLDVGCGWGGMVLHAARHYGVTALGVTLSHEQAEWGRQAVADAGLEGQVTIRHGDYRDVAESDFDAISSIGLTEHIGRANYPRYFAFLYDKLVSEGRMLNHTITRPNDQWPSHFRRSFINRYVFPDGELSGPAQVMGAMNAAGFEIRHQENLREHYALTLQRWCENLDESWDAAAAEAGEATARVWRLYMAAARHGFDINQIQLHQTLGVRLARDGRSGQPLRPRYGEYRAAVN